MGCLGALAAAAMTGVDKTQRGALVTFLESGSSLVATSHRLRCLQGLPAFPMPFTHRILILHPSELWDLCWDGAGIQDLLWALEAFWVPAPLRCIIHTSVSIYIPLRLLTDPHTCFAAGNVLLFPSAPADCGRRGSLQ